MSRLLTIGPANIQVWFPNLEFAPFSCMLMYFGSSVFKYQPQEPSVISQSSQLEYLHHQNFSAPFVISGLK